MSRPRPCSRCGLKPIAYWGREFCYDCVPRARKGSLRCKRCGSDQNYFTAGLCRRCHRSAPVRDSCRDCLAWGVTRRNDWLCEGCRGWHKRFGGPQPCPSCGRSVVLNGRGYCRLCSRHANLLRTPHDSIDVTEANSSGQQLFLADLFRAKRLPLAAVRAHPTSWPSCYPVDHEQLVLFGAVRNMRAAREIGFPAPPLPDLARALDHGVQAHASQHGWGKGLTVQATRGLHLLLSLQDTPGARIAFSEIATLGQLSSQTIQPLVEILTGTGMFHDDRERPLETWFRHQTAGLPQPMADELRQWFEVMRDGSLTPPRSRPRTLGTTRSRVALAVPALRSWAATGHRSLREIEREQVLAVLPTSGDPRIKAIDSMRSLFRLLKARGVIFANPTARLRPDPVRAEPLLPMDLAPLREAINSTDPARAALAGLVAFHALNTGQLQALQTTDLRDGRLFLPNHTVLLAAPVRERLASWLDERGQRWPNTRNAHLFVNFYTAVRVQPVSGRWILATTGIPPRDIRRDRIAHEAIATGGDLRRICDLFGISISSAERYSHASDQPATTDSTVGSPTRGSR